jgi:predicted Zn-dependent protease
MIAADRPKEAESYLEKSVQFANNQQNKLRSQCMLVHLYFVNNKNERAMELAKKMYKASPSEFYAISAMAGALMRFKQYDEFCSVKEERYYFQRLGWLSFRTIT